METSSQDQQQKDFLASFFPQDLLPTQRTSDHQQHSLLPSGTNRIVTQSQMLNNFSGLGASQLNMDLMNDMMVMQGMEMPSSTTLAQFNPQVLLEQQYKLNQLQQLQQLQNQIQNHIFQQQLALIKGQAIVAVPDSSSEHTRDQVSNYHGLPTPVSSTELRPIPSPEYMSPVNQTYMDSHSDMYRSVGMGNDPLPSPHVSMPNQYPRHVGSSSAPANIAFQCPFPLPSPSELDIDVSPLTSPWLGAYHQSSGKQPNKRTASPSGDEGPAKISRKRQSLVTASESASMNPRRTNRPTKSANSTPLLRSTKNRQGGCVGEDSPSPVNISMPPPAPPAAYVPLIPSKPASNDATSMTPVTPASLMELGRIGISSSLTPMTHNPKPQKNDTKSKSALKAKSSTETSTRTLRKAHVPMSPKPILPAGNATGVRIGTSALAQAMPQNRKSHKDAEQKRRDSLKTTFDDLRLLLPPIPLPSDENFPDMPILPGALPPRGPPKAGGEGPNKGVSKLQLLRCGNDYIRQLKGRVNRRDDEIDKLRREVVRLRSLVSEDVADAGDEHLDLECDLDEVEANIVFGQGGSSVAGDDEGDECEE